MVNFYTYFKAQLKCASSKKPSLTLQEAVLSPREDTPWN